MLYEVAALVTSVTHGIVAEAFSAPAQSVSIGQTLTLSNERAAWESVLSGAVSASSPVAGSLAGSVSGAIAGVPSPFIGPQPAQVDPARTALLQLRGADLLTALTALPEKSIREFVAGNPAAIKALETNPPAASEVAVIWSSADPGGLAALEHAAPGLVGNLEGVPYAARDDLNRASLSDISKAIHQRLHAGVGRAERDDLTKRLHLIKEVRAALVTGTSGLRRELVSLDVRGEGRAVIAIGDVSTADYVSYLIPGMFFGVDSQIRAWAQTADELATEQHAWLARGGSTKSVAAVAWIGYQTPTLMNVASMELARDGRDALTASLSGLRAERGANQPYVSVLAHSYGSTAALLSLQEDNVSVDALAMVGSPGSPARTVKDLHVANGNVWVGAAQWDPIPASGVFGSQPASPDYGPHHFGVDGAVDPYTGQQLSAAISHNDYFTDGGESFRNLVLIGIGQGSLVLGNDGAVAAPRMLARAPLNY